MSKAMEDNTFHVACCVMRQAVPNGLSALAMMMVGFTTVLFVSQLHDSKILGGVGVGSMLYNIFGLSLGVGMTSALDTLVSYTNGAGLYERSGVHLQRACVVCTLVCAPSSLILYFTEDFLLRIGQDPLTAHEAGLYVRGAIPSMWFLYMSNAIGTYLRAQTIPHASVYATWTSNILHVMNCYFFIYQLNMGAFGAGLAFSVTQVINCVFVAAYIQFIRPGVTQKSWLRWNCQHATSNLYGFIEKALPCAMLMWAEWWCSEVMTLLAGYLGVLSLAAHTAVLQVFVLVYMSLGGFSCAAAVLVGNAMGASSPALAKRNALVTSAVMLVVCTVVDLVIWCLSDSIPGIFTADPEVEMQIKSLLEILLIVIPLDSLQSVIDGLFRGLGKQGTAFKVKLCCMWGIRLPTAGYLALYCGLGVQGIWWGSTIGLLITMIVYVFLALRIDWDQEADAAHKAYQPLSGSPSQDLHSRTRTLSSQSTGSGVFFSPPPFGPTVSSCGLGEEGDGIVGDLEAL